MFDDVDSLAGKEQAITKGMCLEVISTNTCYFQPRATITNRDRVALGCGQEEFGMGYGQIDSGFGLPTRIHTDRPVITCDPWGLLAGGSPLCGRRFRVDSRWGLYRVEPAAVFKRVGLGCKVEHDSVTAAYSVFRKVTKPHLGPLKIDYDGNGCVLLASLPQNRQKSIGAYV